MNYSNTNNLFRQYSLDDYLRSRTQSLENEVSSFDSGKFNQEESALLEQLVNKYSIKTPTIMESDTKIDAHEAQITLNDRGSRIFDYDDGPVTVKGLSITVSIPFQGNSQLFQCTPSSYTLSGTPDADVRDGKIILSYETTEKDADKIKGLWVNDIRVIKENLGWIERDAINYNNSLTNNIKTMLNKRKKEANESQSLIDKLKQ